MIMKRTLLALLLATLAAGGAAAADVDLSGFDKVLLPLDPSVEIAGANGSRFRTNLDVIPLEPIRFYPDGPTVLEPSIGTFSPNRPVPGLLARQVPASAAGRLLYVEKGKLDPLHMQLTLSTRPADALHELVTSIPIVRERDFRTGTIVFEVTSGAFIQSSAFVGLESRFLLRLYDVDNRGDVAVHVTAASLTAFGSIVDRVVPLSRREGTDPSQPFYAEVPIEAICRPVSNHFPCTDARIRVTIEPLTPGARYWAMLSMTNNFTQDVTLFWPQ